MNKKDEKQIREYVLRMVRNSHSIYKDLFFNALISGKDGFGMNTIIADFARGDSDLIQRAKDDMEIKHSRRENYDEIGKLRIYNYFDLDTLIAYDIYLKKFKQLAYDSVNKDYRGRVKMKDFDYAREGSKKFLDEFAGKKESGFYNPEHPITLLTRNEKGKTVLSPNLTPTDETFEKNYNVFECREKYLKYLDEKEQERNSNGSHASQSDDTDEMGM